MNYSQILKRAWHILWSYKALWIFGIIVALTTANGGGGSHGGGGGGRNSGNSFYQGLTPPAAWHLELGKLGETVTSLRFQEITGGIAALIAAVTCLALALFILSRIAHYVSQVALIRMVDHYEVTEEKVSWKKGFRWGWSRSAARLFLIDLVIYLPFILVLLVLFTCAALPAILASQSSSEWPMIPAMIIAVSLGLLFAFVAFIGAILLSAIMEPIRRTCVLGELGAMNAIRQGWGMVKRNLGEIGLMWLILVCIRIGLAIILVFVILPVVAIGALLGMGVGTAAFFIGDALYTANLGMILAGILGIFSFILVLAVPLTFVGGLVETYFSTTWTLTYRELRAKEADIPAEVLPAEGSPVEEPPAPPVEPEVS